MQIITVTVVFFLYIFAYYMFFYVVNVTAKLVVVFNSFLYSTTHMINPVVYFSLNEEMRNQLKELVAVCCPCIAKWLERRRRRKSCRVSLADVAKKHQAKQRAAQQESNGSRLTRLSSQPIASNASDVGDYVRKLTRFRRTPARRNARRR